MAIKSRAMAYKDFYNRGAPPERSSSPTGKPNIGVPKPPNSEKPDDDTDPRKQALKRRLAKTASGQEFVSRTARAMKSKSMRKRGRQ